MKFIYAKVCKMNNIGEKLNTYENSRNGWILLSGVIRVF
jgi:hypothetical protein